MNLFLKTFFLQLCIILLSSLTGIACCAGNASDADKISQAYNTLKGEILNIKPEALQKDPKNLTDIIDRIWPSLYNAAPAENKRKLIILTIDLRFLALEKINRALIKKVDIPSHPMPSLLLPKNISGQEKAQWLHEYNKSWEKYDQAIEQSNIKSVLDDLDMNITETTLHIISSSSFSPEDIDIIIKPIVAAELKDKNQIAKILERLNKLKTEMKNVQK